MPDTKLGESQGPLHNPLPHWGEFSLVNAKQAYPRGHQVSAMQYPTLEVTSLACAWSLCVEATAPQQ